MVNSFYQKPSRHINILRWHYGRSIMQGRLFSSLPTLPCVPLLIAQPPPTHPSDWERDWHTSEQDPAPFVLGSLFVSSWWTEQQHAAAASWLLYSNSVMTTYCKTSAIFFYSEWGTECIKSCNYVLFWFYLNKDDQPLGECDTDNWMEAVLNGTVDF